eukprot:scpid48110/ scgid3364/ 
MWIGIDLVWQLSVWAEPAGLHWPHQPVRHYLVTVEYRKGLCTAMCVDADAVRAQEVAGIRKLSSSERDKLLEEAGVKPSQPAAGSLLAIKADMNLPWSQVRKLKQWLTASGLHLESERTARAFIADNVPKYTCGEVPMATKGCSGEIVMARMVYFPDLVAVVLHYLQLYDAAKQLTWRNGTIPATEVWIKLGGDHGGHSFKFVMQVANLEHPNSIHNTIPVCVFEAVDTPANIETALGRYREQIVQLQQTQWNGRRLRAFFFGDYDFQTKCYGLSGSSGVRPCIHCLCPKKSMDTEPTSRPDADAEPRTLSTLASDHEKFVAAGSVHSQVKKFNNALRPVTLPVALEDVVIPTLHLDLGIYLWIYDSFMAEVLLLDLKLAAEIAPADTDRTTFTQLAGLYVDLKAVELELATAEEKREVLHQQLQFVMLYVQTGGDHVQTVAANVQQTWQQTEAKCQQLTTRRDCIQADIAKKKAEKSFVGPCAAAIEKVLQDNNIHRQAYHSGSFVGNHINSALKPAVLTSLVSAPATNIAARWNSTKLMDEAEVVQQRYRELFVGYSKCRALFSHCEAMSDEQIEKLQVAVQEFMRCCRKEIVGRDLGKITPKLHLLESHTVPAIKRLRVGLGLLAEHGSESIHARFNTFHRSYDAMPNKRQRLEAICKQQLVNSLPQHSVVLRAAATGRK